MRKTLRMSWAVAGLFFVSESGAAGQAGAEKHWGAQWITAAHAAERDEAVLHFRKTMELKESAGEVCGERERGQSIYLYVNGRETGRGPSRADLAHWRFETYDIAPLLHAGKNTLAALVWHFGRMRRLRR